MRRLLPILALVVGSAGCEEAWSVQGNVKPGADAGFVAASAVLRCPGEPDRLTATDSDGVFELGGSGAGPSLGCIVLVSAPGRAAAAVSLADACEDTVGDRCSVATLEVPLSY
jgi:hypothetical protein